MSLAGGEEELSSSQDESQNTLNSSDHDSHLSQSSATSNWSSSVKLHSSDSGGTQRKRSTHSQAPQMSSVEQPQSISVSTEKQGPPSPRSFSASDLKTASSLSSSSSSRQDLHVPHPSSSLLPTCTASSSFNPHLSSPSYSSFSYVPPLNLASTHHQFYGGHSNSFNSTTLPGGAFVSTNAHQIQATQYQHQHQQ
eukprot:m.77269 g.77269  ORF g.77269 m.77269 type:complete len:195 (+) comp24995_c2_seq2:336-920(+)